MLWLVGRNGMLGSEVATILDRDAIPHVATDREVDITSLARVREFAAEYRPDWIVNCAAYTAVDRAEDEQELAFALNADGPANLGRAAAECDSRVIHVSTDYVFAGNATAAIAESEPPAPTSVYGRSKAAGERNIAAANPDHVIVRTAWLYGPAGSNFVATMLRLLEERDELTVVADQRGAPTYAVDLANAIVRIVGHGSRARGIYHYTNSGETTWFDFAVAIRDEALSRDLIRRRTPVRPVTTADYPTKAVRPAYSVLSLARMEQLLGVQIPPWRESLGRYLDRVKKE